MRYAGYARLVQNESIHALWPVIVAEVRSVTRVESDNGRILVPARVAPQDDGILENILFALKYEGVNFQVLAQALPLIPEKTLRDQFDGSPNSKYLRVTCYLWELFTGHEIQRLQKRLGQTFVRLFNPQHYYTGPERRNERWRVIFNGIGTPHYCVTVRRTPTLDQLLDKNLLQKALDFADSLPKDILNRTLSWAYLSETRDSFAIEKEAVDASKSRRFVEVLKQAHRGIDVNEDTLLDLQNIAIDNPYLKATSYRNEQNYLGTAQSGALGVTYVPPEFQLARELMDCLCELANDPPAGVHPLVLASVVSFGFVFIHPFMDGNGRLSRFLFHQVLCKAGALSDGLVLPVSTVMHRNESDYLEALKSFSEQIPEFWEIWPTSDVEMEFDFKGHEAIYRYWDGTQCCEFMAQCAETAIEQHLKEETIYLNRYDAIYKHINDRFDVASKDLANLVMFCMEQRGQLSNRRRKQYLYRVEEDVFDELELAYQEVVGNGPSATTDQVSNL